MVSDIRVKPGANYRLDHNLFKAQIIFPKRKLDERMETWRTTTTI